MFRKAIRTIVLLLGGGILFGCTKFFDQKPNDKLVADEAVVSIVKARAALNGCYDGLQDYRYYGRNFIIISDIFADNAKIGSGNNGLFNAVYNHSLTAYDQDIAGLWSVCYQVINRTNEIIARVPLLTDGTVTERNQIVGEAYAIRALVYLDLVRTFALPYKARSGADGANENGGHLGVPLVLIPSRADSIVAPSRNTVKEVYTQILSDIKNAQAKLDSKVNRNAFSKKAVDALEIRALFYMGENLAVAGRWLSFFKADTVNYAHAKDTSKYAANWKDLSVSSDVLFAIPASVVDNNAANSLSYAFNEAKSVAVTSDLTRLFSNEDVRKKWFISGLGKYSRNEASIPILRISEVSLNFCEAYYDYLKSANSLDAIALRGLIISEMNKLLTQWQKSGNTLPENVTNDVLYETIIRERRKELAFEGHRLFELKRRQQGIERSDCQSASCLLQYPSSLFAMPIPAAEINANPNIKQNIGY